MILNFVLSYHRRPLYTNACACLHVVCKKTGAHVPCIPKGPGMRCIPVFSLLVDKHNQLGLRQQTVFTSSKLYLQVSQSAHFHLIMWGLGGRGDRSGGGTRGYGR